MEIILIKYWHYKLHGLNFVKIQNPLSSWVWNQGSFCTIISFSDKNSYISGMIHTKTCNANFEVILETKSKIWVSNNEIINLEQKDLCHVLLHKSLFVCGVNIFIPVSLPKSQFDNPLPQLITYLMNTALRTGCNG